MACIPTVATYGVVDTIKYFTRLYPNIRIMMEEMEEDRLLYVLEAKDCDLAFCSTIKLDKTLFDTVFYCRDEFMIAVSFDNPLAQRESVSISDLHDFKLIFNSKESSLYDICKDACGKAGFEPNILFTTSRPDLAYAYLFDKTYIYMGIGHIMEGFDHDSIKVIPITDGPSFEYHFVRHRTNELTHGIKKYLEFVSDRGSLFFEQSKPLITLTNKTI